MTLLSKGIHGDINVHFMSTSELQSRIIATLPNNCKLIKPLDNSLFFEMNNTIFSLDFDTKLIKKVKKFDEDSRKTIRDFFILTQRTILVQFEDTIELLNIETGETIDRDINSKKVLNVFSNIPKNVIHSNRFNECKKIILLVTESHHEFSLEIYEFLNEKNSLKLLCELDSYEHEIDSCVIDGIYSTECIAKPSEETIVRFAMWNKRKLLLSLISVRNESKYCMIDKKFIDFSKKNLILRPWETNISDFYNNKVLLNADGSVYMYDNGNQS
jgi:hypothetical protein